jgi:glycerate-2-kinase
MIKMKSDVLKLFRTAIGAVDPYTCVKHHLVFNDNDRKKELHVGDNNIVLNRNLYVAAFGKAALGMKES